MRAGLQALAVQVDRLVPLGVPDLIGLSPAAVLDAAGSELPDVLLAIHLRRAPASSSPRC